LYNAKKRRTRAFQWRDEIEKFIYSKTAPVDGWRFGRADGNAPASPSFRDSSWPVAKKGQLLGRINEFIWIRNRVVIPRDFAGGRVFLYINTEAAGALFGQRGLAYVNGVETVGLDRFHKDVLLADRARGGERFDIAAEIYTGPVEGFKILDFGDERTFVSRTILESAELRLVDEDAWKAYYDFWSAADILEATQAGSRIEAEVLAAIDEAITALRLYDDSARSDGFRKASSVLHRTLFSGQKGDASGRILAIGQSHIDMAWLWPRAETIRKCASTMANTLSYEAQYPWYRFSHSQAQGFQWIKDLYPALHARTRRAAREKRVEPMGGMWVEADLNCAGGEALVRQFIYGQRFFEKEFGYRARVGWLIDTFGYSWAMPQILKESGLDYFVSTKPTWNDTNTFPFTFFWWEGPDGSRVLTHIPPLTYGHEVALKSMFEALDKNKESRLGVATAYLFGRSDGGGGPMTTDLENMTRLMKSPYAPKIEITNVAGYFDQLPRDVSYPVYADEMYVETHRGTYTTQARTKRNNRKAESALFVAEALAASASTVGHRYPKKDLEAAWKTALFNQFHDILPGSSIALVYEDADKDYAEVLAAADKMTSGALASLAKAVDTRGPGKPVIVFNPSGWKRTDVLLVDAPAGPHHVLDANGDVLPSQSIAGARGRLAVLVTVPPCGYKVIRVVEGRAPRAESVAKVAARRIDTARYSLRLNAAGQISRLVDKSARRDVIEPGAAANRFVMFEDIPTEYEAWDIDEWINEKSFEVKDLISSDVVENGPVRAVVALKWRARKSTISQRMILYGHTARIDFVTEVDWREKKTLLKVAFPLSVRARRATYEIAFGAIDRSTQESNPQDWARFEVPAHKWADLSQADYGVSLLNDAKYGYDAKGNVLRLSLLRSPACPDPNADQGLQQFTYSLLPHESTWQCADTVKEGVDLNVPLVAAKTAASGGRLPSQGSFLTVKAADGGPVVLSAFKSAEDGRGFIVRVYEPLGRDARVTVETGFEIAKAELVNFLEEPKGKIAHKAKSVTMDLAPWKIASLRLQR
jgi:alpha-mannosidase